MKKCFNCKTEKEFDNFHKSGRNKDGYQSWCRQCNTEWAREKIRNNRNFFNAKNRAYALRGRQFIYDFLKVNPCSGVLPNGKRCKEKDPLFLEFDHTDPKTKKEAVANLCKSGINAIKKEIEKCVVLCVKCHRRKTAEQQNWYKNVVK